VSSILDALRKLEAAGSPPTREATLPARRPATLRRTAGLLLGAFAAGAALASWLRSGPPPETAPSQLAAAEPVASPAPPHPPAVEAPSRATAAPALPRTLADVDPPHGVSGNGGAPEAAAPRVPVQAAVALAPPPRPSEEARPRTSARRPTEPPRPTAGTAEAVAPLRRADEQVLPRGPAGAPRVRLSLLMYSRAPERRSVALTIDGGNLITLHEGESAGGFEVARILPDRVQLRHAGQLFALRARD